jgi:hypothetical protein
VTADRLRIIVLGYLIRGPLGGFASYHLQYLLGLHRLGHDVYFIEDSDDYPGCYDPVTSDTGYDPAYGLRFARRVFDRVGLADRWAYHDAHSRTWLGPCADRVFDTCRRADVVINIGGANPLRPWLMDVPVRVFIDLDPVFTQIRHLTDAAARERALQHTCFFTVGENIDGGRSTVPDDNLPWQRTRQPVVLDFWPVTPARPSRVFTTVMLWDSYAPVDHNGVRYGMKSASFAPYFELPERVGPVLELAVGGDTAPRQTLCDKGWRIRDSTAETVDPWTYQDYIQSSRGEFSIAKHGYVISRSGWFSDRSLAYLASARPVILQETGFSDWLPTGLGVIPFSTLDEAVDAVHETIGRYEIHCHAARTLAAEYFDAFKVLPRMIESAMTRTQRIGP